MHLSLSLSSSGYRGKKGVRDEGIYFLVGVSFCVSAAEVNNPRTPSCASRHLESEGSYFIAGKGNRLRPAKIQIFRKSTEEKETGGRGRNEDALSVALERSMKSFCSKRYMRDNSVYKKFLLFASSQSLTLSFFNNNAVQINVDKFLTFVRLI